MEGFVVPCSTELTDEQYKELWTKLGPIQIKMTEKVGVNFLFIRLHMINHKVYVRLYYMCWIYTCGELLWAFLHGNQIIAVFTGSTAHPKRVQCGKWRNYNYDWMNSARI